MGYYLIDHKNPYGNHFYTTRYNRLRVIVLHITAGLEDLSPPDHSAERTAAYAASTSRAVSWHAGVDSDSIVELLPPEYTAWHVGGFNSPSYGIEISKSNTDWDNDAPEPWRTATLRNAAIQARKIAKDYGIPFKVITADEARAGRWGFCPHWRLDPSRRSDPGLYRSRDTFPYKTFFDLCRNPDGGTMEDLISNASPKYHIRRYQRVLNYHGERLGLTRDPLEIDGDWGKRTESYHQRVAELTPWTAGTKGFIRGVDYLELRLQIVEDAVKGVEDAVKAMNDLRDLDVEVTVPEQTLTVEVPK